MARAFITGIAGQDGSYLAELLLDKGYEVHGAIRKTTDPARSRLAHLCANPDIHGRRLFLYAADLEDPAALRCALVKAAPDEVYHLAGTSRITFDNIEHTCDITAMATIRLIEMIRELSKPAKLFHTASSEMFGRPNFTPQDEETPFAPVNTYGCAKVFAFQMIKVYRQTFGFFGCSGIMFNHESPRRGENFVTRKICRAAAAIKLGLQNELLLGDTSAQRDWGDARDYVRGMWLALQHATPEDFVFATGKLHSVQDVIDIAFKTVGIDPAQFVKRDPQFLRPTEPQKLIGNAAKAKRLLGWEPTRSFEQLIAEMTEREVATLQQR